MNSTRERTTLVLNWLIWLVAVGPVTYLLACTIISINNGEPTFSLSVAALTSTLLPLYILHALSYLFPKASRWIWLVAMSLFVGLLYGAWVVHQPGNPLLRLVQGILVTQFAPLFSWLFGAFLARKLHLPIYKVTTGAKANAYESLT